MSPPAAAAPNGEGSVFDLTPPASPGGAWTGTLLYSFTAGADGGSTSSAAAGPGGVVYGTNELGASADAGTVFALSPPAAPGGAWTETTLYTFQIERQRGGHGVPVDPTRHARRAVDQTILKSFGYGYNCGPDSPLILHNGDLYGAACQSGGGVVFKLEPPSAPGGAWTTTYLHHFIDGQVPGGAMVLTKKGPIYGATIDESSGTGTIYEIAP